MILPSSKHILVFLYLILTKVIEPNVMRIEMKLVCIFTAALKIKTMLSCYCREVNTGSMFGPLENITNKQISGSECHLVGHKEG